MKTSKCDYQKTGVKNALYSHSDIRTANRPIPQQLCCSHGFSHHKSYVTCLRLPILVLYKDELISTQDHVTAETHAAKLASRRPTRYLYTETVNDFNNCVVHTASIVTNLYTSPVCAFLVLYNAVLISTQGHVTAESLSLRPPSWRVVVRSVTCTRKPQMTSTTVLFTRLQL